MTVETKAQRIRCLLAEGLTPKQVAAHILCTPEYVRAVRQRQLGGGRSAADKKYESSARGRQKKHESARHRYHAKYKHKAVAFQRAHREALKAGLSQDEANRLAREAYRAAPCVQNPEVAE